MLIHYYPALGIKLVAGVVLGLVFLWQYERRADTFAMHDLSILITDLLWSDPENYWEFILYSDIPVNNSNLSVLTDQPRVAFFIKILSFLNVLTLNNYWINSLYFSLFTYFALYALANTIIDKFAVSAGSVAIAFLYFPSVVFWSSGLLKEPLAIACMAFMISFVLNILDKDSPDWIRLSLLPLLAYIILKVKFYYVAVLGPVLLAYGLAYLINKKFELRAGYQLLLFVVLLMVGSALATTIHPLLRLDAIAVSIYDNYQATITNSLGENYYQFDKLKPTIGSMIVHFPEALTTGLFRPSLLDIHNILGLLAAIENLLVTLITGLAVVNVIKRRSIKEPLAITASVIYVISLASLLALASPNFGTLVRYKVSFLPFFILLILEGVRWDKLFNKSKR